MRAVAERNLSAHGEHVGIGSEREEHGGKNREHFHGLVEFVRKERVVGIFQCLDSFLLAFEQIPQTDVGTDEVLIVDKQLFRDMRMIALGE